MPENPISNMRTFLSEAHNYRPTKVSDTDRPYLHLSVDEVISVLKEIEGLQIQVTDLNRKLNKIKSIADGTEELVSTDFSKEILLKLEGKCPECKMYIKNYKPVLGTFAPEWWQAMREQGIDPGTGHKNNCSKRSLKL